MNFDRLSPTTTFEEIVLDLLHVHASERISGMMLQRLELHADHFVDGLVASLHSYVMADRLLDQVETVPVTVDATFETGGVRRSWLLLVMPLVLTALGTATSSWWTILLACVASLAGLCLLAANLPGILKDTVSTTVDVKGSTFAVYPEARALSSDVVGNRVVFHQTVGQA